MKVWVLTYSDCCELDGVFSSREKARNALKERVENGEDIRDFRMGDEPFEDFEFYQFKNSYESVEAIIQEKELDKVY
jgi:hypothetical protein